MTEDEARRVLLLRSFEEPITAPWSAAERDAASGEASRRVGEAADPDTWLAARAAVGSERLASREPAVGRALRAATWPGAELALLLPLAFLAGLALDGASGGARINLFAPPLLAMLAWNLVVYALLAAGALRPALPHRLHAALVRRLTRSTARLPAAPARFVAAWWQASAPLQSARIAALLHAAAALLALGMLASMYARGAFFEFRAGWDSTFFDPATLHRLMTLLFGPAAALGGITLPGPDEFAALRFSAGSGERAARWIHLFAITVAVLVVLPRTLLGALAAARADRLARRFPLPMSASGDRLRPVPGTGDATPVLVLPYGHRLPADGQAGLRRALEDELGHAVVPTLADSLAIGDEEQLATRLAPAGAPAVVAVLFALTATPERETHGALLQALAAARPAAPPALVLLDETAFRQRFGDGERLAQRREAWRAFLAELGHRPAWLDLARPTTAAVER